MTIKEALKQAADKLKKSTSPQLDAEVLLCFVLNKDKSFLYSNLDKELSGQQVTKFEKLITQRQKGVPIAYLTNHKEFFGLDFYIDKNVLIPRPETEGLVELILQTANNRKYLNILDIGTGSGVIIISLAKLSFAHSVELGHRYFASDISTVALKVAKRNAKRHKVKVTFKQGSLLTPWKNQRFDIIVANLPYLSKETDPSTKFEPKKALIATNKGLRLFEEAFKQIARLNNPFQPSLKLRGGADQNQKPSSVSQLFHPLNLRGGGLIVGSRGSYLPEAIFLEIGDDQKSAIKKLATKWLPEYKLIISKDLSGRERYAELRKES
jgi:release factor glutamine methyltransferase